MGFYKKGYVGFGITTRGNNNSKMKIVESAVFFAGVLTARCVFVRTKTNFAPKIDEVFGG